jgi:alkylation response protein AidB-like acyl-CoA dehydrogenase
MEGDTPRQTASGEPEVRLAFFPSEACEILDTWHVLGMRGTGSDDVAVHDVFVPRMRTCGLLPEFVPGAHYQGPLYRFPAMGATAALFPPIVLAIARNAIDVVAGLAQEKTPFGATTVLRARASAQAKVAQAEGALRAVRALVYTTLGEAWERSCAGEGLPPRRRQTCCLPRCTPHAVQPRWWS